MVKEILKKLNKNEQKINEKEKQEIGEYINIGIVKKDDEENYRLNSKYAIGTISMKGLSSAQLITYNEHQKINIDTKDLNGAYNNDFVLVQRIFHPRAKTRAKVIEVLEKSLDELMVYKKEGIFYSVKDNCALELKDIGCDEDQVILIENGKVKKKIGDISDPVIDEEISLRLYAQEYRKEVKEIEIDSKIEHQNRIDLTHLPFCTIDPASAKDHDDAVCFDKLSSTLYVAIADVSHFVKEGSYLDEQARKRGFSIYLPHKVLPMLPAALSEELCSLKENVKRLAYLFKMELDVKKTKVKKSELFEAVIESKKRFSYGRIDRVLEKKFDTYSEKEKEIFDSLLELYKVTSRFRNKRLEQGYDFDSKEYRQKLNHKQELESVCVEESSPSHSLIEECMLLANIEASKKAGSRAIFRVHEEPSMQKISELVSSSNALGLKAKLTDDIHKIVTNLQRDAKAFNLKDEVDEMIIQSQQQARYSVANSGHFGLGFNSYAHFTSPIRRYSDLVLHRILKSSHLPKDIEDICEDISDKERNIDQLVWDFEDRKYARWAKSNIGFRLWGKVVDIEKALVKCYEGMPGMRVYIENYRGQKLFSKVNFEIIDADIMGKKVVGRIK